MGMTSIMVGRGSLLELRSSSYQTDVETYHALHHAVPTQPRLVDMAARHPAYQGSTPQARQIPLLVYILNPSMSQRLIDKDALLAALDNTSGLVALQWTEDGVTKRYWCHVSDVAVSMRLYRAAATLIAPDPVAETVP